ncbi:MAG: hypothetical protein O2904_01420 [bacterium]|nr:hypothetical protein [bacterium]
MFRKMSSTSHVVLLLLFACAMIGVWLLPMILAGQVYDINPLLLARNVSVSGQFILTDEIGRFLAPHLLTEAGIFSTADGRLSALFFAWVHQWVAWGDHVMWSAVAAKTMALSLVIWWFFIVKLFDRRIAWISTILIAFMPLYWRQAVWLDDYNLAFVFLFSSFAAYVYLQEKSRIGALLLSGALFGACAAAKDTFLIFVPWFCIGYYWAHRTDMKKVIIGIAVFGIAALVVYLILYIGDIRTLGYPVNHNLAAFWPGASEVREGFYLHAYPDPYTYFFAREAYDQTLLSQFTELTRIQQYQQYKSFINFGIGDIGVIGIVLNGLWLFVGSIPELFQQEHIGGAVLWLFILPGFLILRRDRRVLSLQIVGLIVSAEVIMRFFLHYGRNHLMDYGWILALLAAIGIAGIADKGLQHSKKIVTMIVLVLVVQLVQANRTIFARRYDHPSVSYVVAVSDAINLLDKDAVIALGIGPTQVTQVAQLSHATVVPFAEKTVAALLDEKKVSEAFETYGITHVYGYGEDTLRRVRFQTRSIESLDVDVGTQSKSISPIVTWLLHVIR